MSGIPTIVLSGSVGADLPRAKAENREKDVKLVREILKSLATGLKDRQYDPGNEMPSLICAWSLGTSRMSTNEPCSPGSSEDT